MAKREPETIKNLRTFRPERRIGMLAYALALLAIVLVLGSV